jgi:uncharacterized damage-inducible protein DinB
VSTKEVRMPDTFDALRRAHEPHRPDPVFAAALLQRLEQEAATMNTEPIGTAAHGAPSVVDEFLRRWPISRNTTLEFLELASDELLDFRPGPAFRTVREQANHLARAQGVFQLALRGEQPDFSREQEFAPASSERDDIVVALGQRDRELAELLDALRPVAATLELVWAGMSIADFEVHHVQHESLHHGQWVAHARLLGHPLPPGWMFHWAL